LLKFIPIFEDRLFAVCYGDGNCDEFIKLFNNWFDPEYLENFFNQHEKDLKSGFFGSVSIDEAIYYTREEAKHLQRRLLELSSATNRSLDEIFKPLHKSGHSVSPFLESKAYGERHKRWLRIYALKIDDGVYLITGGAIKLTDAMQDRSHTAKELKKLDQIYTYFKEQGVGDFEGFMELTLE
jgi:hypothetical protein